MKIVLLIIFYCISVHASDSIYAIRGGVLAHSTGLISSGMESGVDLHAELLYKDKLFNAYPAVGTDVSLNGDTSFLYTTLVWEDRFLKQLLLGISFGLAVHDGELDTGSPDRRQLGSRVLIRGAIDIGYFVCEHVAVSFVYAHYSHTGIKERNQGNDNIGFRASYYF